MPSQRKHVALLEELDVKKVSLGKAINEAESSLANKEAELARLKEELQALEEEDPAADHDLNATASVYFLSMFLPTSALILEAVKD